MKRKRKKNARQLSLIGSVRERGRVTSFGHHSTVKKVGGKPTKKRLCPLDKEGFDLEEKG